ERHHRAPQAHLSAVLALAQRRSAESHADAPDRERVLLAIASNDQPEPTLTVQFSMQSGGAEMLRLAAWRLCEAGIIPVMLVHDGILLEETERERIEQAKEIMRQAGRDVCGGFEIGVDVDQMLIGGARYHDKRPMAGKMWATMGALENIGALPRRVAS